MDSLLVFGAGALPPAETLAVLSSAVDRVNEDLLRDVGSNCERRIDVIRRLVGIQLALEIDVPKST